MLGEDHSLDWNQEFFLHPVIYLVVLLVSLHQSNLKFLYYSVSPLFSPSSSKSNFCKIEHEFHASILGEPADDQALLAHFSGKIMGSAGTILNNQKLNYVAKVF